MHIGIVVRISEGGQHFHFLCRGVLPKYLQNLVRVAGKYHPLEEMFLSVRVDDSVRRFPRNGITTAMYGLHGMVETQPLS